MIDDRKSVQNTLVGYKTAELMSSDGIWGPRDFVIQKRSFREVLMHLAPNPQYVGGARKSSYKPKQRARILRQYVKSAIDSLDSSAVDLVVANVPYNSYEDCIMAYQEYRGLNMAGGAVDETASRQEENLKIITSITEGASSFLPDPCPSCGKTNVLRQVAEQRRSADEGVTYTTICTNCGYSTKSWA